MIRRLYLILGRAVGPIAIISLRIVSQVSNRPRARVLVFNERNELLLVKNVISRGQWSLPGGGVNRGEELAEAARRELHEEVGIDRPTEQFMYVTTLDKQQTGMSFIAPIFAVHVKTDDLPKQQSNPLEIAEIGWFSPDDLPEKTSLSVTVAYEHCRSVG